jgi:hypothetical protein|tara:strand:- start:2534 stop:2905 length:372 start_codon:yes stop_codon:yes gene_type:complete
MIKSIVSLVLTICISTLFGLIFIDNFKVVFAIATILQFIGFYIFNNIYENFLRKQAIVLSVEFERERAKNVVTVNCPCSENNQQSIQMTFNDDTLYECSKCKKEIRASNNVSTLMTTVPIYTQ